MTPREEERAAIVAWMRGRLSRVRAQRDAVGTTNFMVRDQLDGAQMELECAANLIERGDHRAAKEMGK